MFVGNDLQVGIVVLYGGIFAAGEVFFYGSMCLLIVIMPHRLRITIDENYLAAESKQTSKKIPWSSFEAAKEERKLFWFKGGRGNFFIPKRAFANEDAMTDFRALVKTKMGERAALGR